MTPRQKALAAGGKTYFTGKPCPQGHISKRYVISMACVVCDRLRTSAWRLANLERSRLRSAAWYEGHKEKRRAEAVAYRKTNPEKTRASTTKWRRANLRKSCALVAKRHTAKLHRTPPWADLEAIEAFYVARPAGHHVDHKIPLQGKLISGLHVLENLQYLPAVENLSKGNRIDLAAPELL